MSTKIPYLDEMWGITSGCGDDMVSPGCLNCYARRMFGRNLWKCPECKGEGELITLLGDGVDCTACDGTGHQDFAPTFHASRLDQPLHWRKPRRVGVSFMGDLFHEAITDEQIRDVFDVAIRAPQHTYVVLTKRARRMASFMRWYYAQTRDVLANVHLCVTVCNQEEVDRDIPILLDTPAAVRGISLEPMLGGVDLQPGWWIPPLGGGPKCNVYKPWETPPPSLDWVVLGGESGAGARPMDPRWATQVFKDCRETGVPFFFKQPGSHLAREDKLGPTGRDWALWDEMVRTQELPAALAEAVRA